MLISKKLCIFAYRKKISDMHKVLILLGSNTYSKLNIDKAKRMLLFYFPDIAFSKSSITFSDTESKFPFRNVLAIFTSELTVEEIIAKLKTIESAMGRTPKDKEVGRILIDLDLLGYDDTIVRPKDFEKEYVQNLLGVFN